MLQHERRVIIDLVVIRDLFMSLVDFPCVVPDAIADAWGAWSKKLAHISEER
jgi:hypothetical protein